MSIQSLYDVEYFVIMTDGLNDQTQLREALSEKDQSDRYASFLRYCRGLGRFEKYEPMVEAVVRAYREQSAL